MRSPSSSAAAASVAFSSRLSRRSVETRGDGGSRRSSSRRSDGGKGSRASSDFAAAGRAPSRRLVAGSNRRDLARDDLSDSYASEHDNSSDQSSDSSGGSSDDSASVHEVDLPDVAEPASVFPQLMGAVAGTNTPGPSGASTTTCPPVAPLCDDQTNAQWLSDGGGGQPLFTTLSVVLSPASGSAQEPLALRDMAGNATGAPSAGTGKAMTAGSKPFFRRFSNARPSASEACPSSNGTTTSTLASAGARSRRKIAKVFFSRKAAAGTPSSSSFLNGSSASVSTPFTGAQSGPGGAGGAEEDESCTAFTAAVPPSTALAAVSRVLLSAGCDMSVKRDRTVKVKVDAPLGGGLHLHVNVLLEGVAVAGDPPGTQQSPTTYGEGTSAETGSGEAQVISATLVRLVRSRDDRGRTPQSEFVAFFHDFHYAFVQATLSRGGP
ncbi:hypothetical protein I4F81_010779 [Pyropia yezoensis]|uniref:Uncharacterized protein n=1 Tax=Pyropia yezoensis TaxID=2788 RepID=A0ACC3CE56_PYRYE|nr:hypothetical protein I4F81_010779 [Neopyropia yezoensis]